MGRSRDTCSPLLHTPLLHAVAMAGAGPESRCLRPQTSPLYVELGYFLLPRRIAET